MPNILLIETATQVCSVGLSIDSKIISIKESHEQNAHSKILNSFIEEIFSEANIDLEQLDAIAVSKGPGSYTGLRIGVSSAKGLCYSLDIPLIAIETLYSIAEGSRQRTNAENTLFCPMIDARRMEVYCAIFDMNLNKVEETCAKIITKDSFNEILEDHKVIFAGDGSAKCKRIIQHPNATFIEDIHPSANYIANVAEKKFRQKQFEDVAYFEPFYLKDFIAGIPKVKGLK